MSIFFFFNDTATTEIYTLSLHDALPISPIRGSNTPTACAVGRAGLATGPRKLNTVGTPSSLRVDRKSTRLNSSHLVISYAVFCLKKKKKKYRMIILMCKHDMSCNSSHYV